MEILSVANVQKVTPMLQVYKSMSIVTIWEGSLFVISVDLHLVTNRTLTGM